MRYIIVIYTKYNLDLEIGQDSLEDSIYRFLALV
jgi:hypothetical protein